MAAIKTTLRKALNLCKKNWKSNFCEDGTVIFINPKEDNSRNLNWYYLGKRDTKKFKTQIGA